MVSILHIGCPFFPHKGGSVVRFSLLNEPIAQRNIVTTITPTLNGDIKQEFVNQISTYRFDPASIKNIFKLISVAVKTKPNIVVLHNNRVLLIWILFVKWFLSSTNIVYEIHSLRDDTKIKKRMAIWLYSFVDLFLVLSKKTEDILEQEYNVKTDVQIIYNGFEKVDFKPCTVENQKIVFSYIGSFHDWQGVEVIVDAYKLLANEMKEKMQLVLIGGGPLFEQLKGRLNDEINKKWVQCHGWMSQTEALQVMSSTDIVLMPRLSTRGTETVIPLKAVEAGMMGKCVIASSVGGLLEGLGEENALWVKPGDVHALKEAMEWVIMNPEMCNNLGKRLYQYARQYPTWEESSKKMEDVLLKNT